MRVFFILIFFVSVLHCNAQQLSLLDCANVTETLPKPSNIEVYIFSHPHCGYCQIAIDDIGNWSKGKAVHIIAMDLSGDVEAVRQHKLYLEHKVEVRDASQCGKKVKKLIPRIYIVNTKTKKRLMKLKGWNSSDLAKFDKKLKKHL